MATYYTANEWVELVRTVLTSFGEWHTADGIDLAPLKVAFGSLIDSPVFQHHLCSDIDAHFSASFLVSHFTQHTARSVSPDQLENLGEIIKGQLDTIIAFTFRIGNSHAVKMFPSINNARLFALQSALHRRYPLLASEGCASLSRPPVIYLTEGSPFFQHLDSLSWELLTARNSFRVIPLRKSVDDSAGDEDIATYSIDLAVLEREIIQDKAKGQLPCCVVATVGANLHQASPYQCDNLEELRKICDGHGLWLHSEGSSLLLAASHSATTMQPVNSLFECCDSICTEPLGWFNTHGSAGLAFVRGSEGEHVKDSVSAFCNTFQLWYQLVSRPPRYIADTVETHLTVANHLKSLLLQKNAQFPVLVGPQGDQHAHLLFFQFKPPPGIHLGAFNLDTNSLNKWLYSQISNRIERFKSAAARQEESQSPAEESKMAPDESGALDNENLTEHAALFEHAVSQVCVPVYALGFAVPASPPCLWHV